MPEFGMYFCFVVHDSGVFIGALIQGYTNPWCQVAQAAKFCTVAPDKCVIIQLSATHSNRLILNVFWRLVSVLSSHHEATAQEQKSRKQCKSLGWRNLSVATSRYKLFTIIFLLCVSDN